MSLNALATRTESPTVSSRTASPIPQIVKQHNQDAHLKNDKAYRRYAATLEKTLSTWEIAPEEWADYIAFLSRLLKAIQSGSPGATVLPHTAAIASKLAQCLNPTLPSGVHSKALEVYSYIFSTFGRDHVASQIHDYLPGLFPLLSFTSLSVRPALYDLLEEYVVTLEPMQLRPVLKSFILSILPALEDENSEDFDRALTTISRLERTYLRDGVDPDLASFWWQSIFLSVITSPSRRQGALNYLNRRLPRFNRLVGDADVSAPELESIVSPEPGLLIRAFSCGLSDPQLLIQRGFLDMLTTNIPLDSPLLQDRVDEKDFQLLISAALSVLLRRDMSLNRRVWQWLLGPEAKDDETEHNRQQQLQYITKYGLDRLETALLNAFAAKTTHLSERVKPFRISLSLMDRWEIGGSLISRIFLPAMRCAHTYSQNAAQAERIEFKKSVSLFFDGVESQLIWARLLSLVDAGLDGGKEDDQLVLLLWVLSSFNVREEEMAVLHAPLLTLYTLANLLSRETSDIKQEWFDLLETLTSLMSTRGRTLDAKSTAQPLPSLDKIRLDIHDYYKSDALPPPLEPDTLNRLILSAAQSSLLRSMEDGETEQVKRCTVLYVQILQTIPSVDDASFQEILASAYNYLNGTAADDTRFPALAAVSNLLAAMSALPQSTTASVRQAMLDLETVMTPIILHNISPSRPRYGVEAIKLLWRVHSLLEHEHIVQASIQALVTSHETVTRKTNVATFLNLWNHSVSQSIGSAKSPMPGSMRRASSSTMTALNDASISRSQTLRQPLLTALGCLQDPSDPAFDEVVVWLNASVHTEAALLILFEQLRDALNTPRTHISTRDSDRARRAQTDNSRALRYALSQFDSILRYAQATFWAVLCSCQLPGARPTTKHPALTALAEQCLMLLPPDNAYDGSIHFLATSVLDRIISAPQFVHAAIHVPDLGTIVCQKLLNYISTDSVGMQLKLLELSIKALSWQQSAPRTSAPPARASAHTRKMSLVGPPLDAVWEDVASTTNLPTDLLVQLLKAGLSTQRCSPYLDIWLRLVDVIIPVLGSTVTTVLIPMIEAICKTVMAVSDKMQGDLEGQMIAGAYAPETTIIKLLDSVEIFLQAAHRALVQDEAKDEVETEVGSTVLANITPNMFKSQGPPSKTAKANNRLTAILASKDVVRTCLRIWRWTSSTPEASSLDRLAAGSFIYVAQRLKTRTRHMLEELFNLEPLESLEVIVSQWLSAEGAAEKESVISVLHVLNGIRPKNTVPAILDALCSRANPALLPAPRQSTLTSDLTAAELTLFYSAYLDSLEDDALEEVWTDCTTFLRDVLSNPLPHRQILPALIWIVFQLAQKLENTNYGERKRMKRELGDNFQRLLAATFAALPSGSLELTGHDNIETAFAAGLQDMNLVVILREIVGRAELILETSDRVALCINTVSTNIITPNLRSKTFPSRVNADMLALVLRVAKKSPAGRVWRKDVNDAFNDTRFVTIPPGLLQDSWFPILQQWSFTDKERLTELIARLYAPTSAGIMFGVGASAARLDADRKTQFNLRRIALLQLAAPVDSHVEHLRTLQEKIVELFEASTTSSPSSAVKAELFMLLRALLLSTSAVHFAPLWPIINDNLKSALLGLDSDEAAQNNLSLLQACKLLDLLASMAPDEFQLFEWIYLTNTTDAVYHHDNWTPVALSDNLGISKSQNGTEEEADREMPSQSTTQTDGLQTPLLIHGAGYDTEDIKALARETFVNTALRPFLSQMSIGLYESRYRLDRLDLSAFKQALIEDLQDAATVVSS